MAGIIDQVGADVTAFTPGDEVFGTVPSDSIAEFLVSVADYFAIKPAELSWEVAGSLALAGQTAFDELAPQSVTEADTVLVSAAAGGVGVIPLVYRPGLVERLRAAAPQGITVVFDHHGAETIEAAIELGVDKSRINTIATEPKPSGIRRVGRGPTNTATLDQLAAMVVRGDLVIPIEATFPLDDVVAAFTRLEHGHLRGKVVIVV